MKNYKKDFPIFKQHKNLVYLDSAATSQKPLMVVNAIEEFYKTYNANIHRGLYHIAEKATEKVEETRGKVAKFINASSPSEIIFTHGTTESLNLIMYSWGKNNIKKGDVVVTTIMEHHANFVPWQELAKEKEAVFEVIDITEEGYINERDLLLQVKDAKIFVFSHVSNVLGTVTDVQRIIKKIREINNKILIVVDAAQSAPHMLIDVQKIDCDFLAFSGHKMLAETGVGVLYGKNEVLNNMEPFLFGGDMIASVARDKTTYASIPNKFEAGTLHISGIISLGSAIDYLEQVGIDKMQDHERSLVKYAIEQIKKIEGVSILGPVDSQKRSGVITFIMENVHAHDVAQILADDNICVRSGHHCAMPLHTRFGLSASTRASFYIYNDEEDIEAFIKGLIKVRKVFK